MAFKLASERHLNSILPSKLASKRHLGSTWPSKLAFWSAPDLQKHQFSLGKPWFLQGVAVCCRIALGQLFRGSWTPFGRLLKRLGQLLGASWSQLGASWAPLGASWAPLGANLVPLERLLEPTWSQLGASWAPLGASWAPLGLNLAALAASWAQLGAFWEPQGLHLALPTGLLLYFICTAQGAAKFNNTSFVVPQGLPSATVQHCQRNFMSMESTGAG